MLLTSEQVLTELGLYVPGKHKKVPLKYITWLVNRNLLARKVLGPRTFRYEQRDVQKLKTRNEKEGLALTLEPFK